jgi:two-component system response regulator AtoC
MDREQESKDRVDPRGSRRERVPSETGELSPLAAAVPSARRDGAGARLKNRRILVVDDERAIRVPLQARFAEEGALVETAHDCATARSKVAAEQFDLIVLDHRLPDGTGMALLEQWKAKGQEVDAEIVMMTAYGSTSDAVKAMRLGAADYQLKDYFDIDEMVLIAERALERHQLLIEVERQRREQRRTSSVSNLIGPSEAMATLRSLIDRVARSGARTILIRGESGTGKDLVARAIHFASPQHDRPFLNVTCTALPETLLESELFGHEKGAFTDAKNAKVGLFEQADGGTIFLDEIGDMPLSLQAKLLRFLESKQFRRLGGLRDIEVDVRIIAATNRDLEQAIASGQFRSDLYYRLNVIPIEISPLRERPEDVIPLAQHFLKHFATDMKKTSVTISGAALECLRRHDWPGNVREVRNVLERAVLLTTGDQVDVADLPQKLRFATGTAIPVEAPQPAPPATESHANGDSREPISSPLPADSHPARLLVLPERGIVFDDLQKDLLEQALDRCGGNKSRAAELLGIHRDQVRYWVKKFDLTRFIQTRPRNPAATTQPRPWHP